MTDFAVPIPVMPPWLSLSWTPTRAALVVECALCRNADVLYTALLLKDPDALTVAVAKHEACRP